MRCLTSSVIPEGITGLLLMWLYSTNGAFITEIWICIPYAWLLLFHGCIQESCGLSFKPCPVFVSCCFVCLAQFSIFRVVMYSADIRVKPSGIVIYGFVLVCSVIGLCMFVVLYEM